ncbi:CatB-related O-acetyltransferase [Paenibacillus sp. ACRRX]|uniref:CatB-related O-acetyltransferase n=1 Tax=Paenibacillus sp. ACRRX TaxID=2918206 RepID=UPI001EF7076F|nr:CatB-related O-acetyltransferase [Paenibacillus sp. ACRRX]MCG7407036.1 CatB-related O-acetyltransferase [Paenibacillus sp. ACRRX]
MNEDEFKRLGIFMNQNVRYAAYSIGDFTYGQPDVLSWGEGASLTIGKFCSIAPRVTIMLGGEHNVDWVTTYPFNPIFSQAQAFLGHPKTKGNVIIGNDVWIGIDSYILSGVTIGNGAVVSARSLVTKDVPPYAIVGGNPARIIRYRFSDEQIAELEDIAWWKWPIHHIFSTLPLLLSNRIDEFIQQAKLEGTM